MDSDIVKEIRKEEKNGNHLRPIFLAAYFIAAVMSGVGGSFVWLDTVGPNIVRPDPAYGSEIRVLEHRLTALEYHIQNHPDVTNKFDSRIAVLETHYDIIINNQVRIMDRLDKRPQ